MWTTKNNRLALLLAPLAGFTSSAFRLLASRHGADLTYTEMVSAAGLAHNSVGTERLLATHPDEGPVVAQLFGAKCEELAFAAHHVASLKRFVALDLNAGCPMTKVTRSGAGSALVTKPELVHDLLAAMVKESGGLPVTLKTRPGARPDKVLMLELLAAAQDAGARGLTLHARFTSQLHSGAVHLDLLADLVRAAHIPIAGNGGVKDAATFAAMVATGVSAVMIGRAALARPDIFATLRGEMPLAPLQLFTEHLALLDEPAVLPTVRVHLVRYLAGLPNAAKLRAQLHSLHDLDSLHTFVRHLSGVL